MTDVTILGATWVLLSGAVNYSSLYPEDYFYQLLKASETISSTAKGDIEKVSLKEERVNVEGRKSEG